MSRHQLSPNQRQLRVGEELRHALARILERGEVRDPGLSGIPVTVTEVRVSPDLRQATVFVMPLGGESEQTVVTALGRAKGFLRRRLADTVHLKFAPDLAFRLDKSFAEADRIVRALQDPAVSRDLVPSRRGRSDDVDEENADENDDREGSGSD
jgi:ribosome-binding factor A